uniref:Uncharacterized protein n=1 Tax=Populus trichocarpa TaxID=3694 RepID=A0A2K1ZG31_POPTR
MFCLGLIYLLEQMFSQMNKSLLLTLSFPIVLHSSVTIDTITFSVYPGLRSVVQLWDISTWHRVGIASMSCMCNI